MGISGAPKKGGNYVSDFGETVDAVGRKIHRCIACYEGIPKGDRHKHFKGKWSGDWQDWRMHSECYTAMDDDDFEDGFEPGAFSRPAPLEKKGTK